MRLSSTTSRRTVCTPQAVASAAAISDQEARLQPYGPAARQGSMSVPLPPREEEMFLIIEGERELRFGDKRYPIRKHDVIACPPGGPEVAHQIINTGKTTMRYLALSTCRKLTS